MFGAPFGLFGLTLACLAHGRRSLIGLEAGGSIACRILVHAPQLALVCLMFHPCLFHGRCCLGWRSGAAAPAFVCYCHTAVPFDRVSCGSHTGISIWIGSPYDSQAIMFPLCDAGVRRWKRGWRTMRAQGVLIWRLHRQELTRLRRRWVCGFGSQLFHSNG